MQGDSQSTDEDDVPFSMLENGLDFILSGLKYIGAPT